MVDGLTPVQGNGSSRELCPVALSDHDVVALVCIVRRLEQPVHGNADRIADPLHRAQRRLAQAALTMDGLPHLHMSDDGLMVALGYNGRGIAMATALGTALGVAPTTPPRSR